MLQKLGWARGDPFGADQKDWSLWKREWCGLLFGWSAIFWS